MAALFNAASSQRLRNSSPPLTDYPFTVGAWVKPAAIGAAMRIFSLADTGTTNNHLSVYIAGGGNCIASAAAGGAEANASAGQFNTTRWGFVLGRFISSTNRRIAAFQIGNATFAAAQNTTARAPSSMDTMAIGALESSSPTDFFDGLIAEFWLANADVLPGGGAFTADLMQTLALGGPFSWPHIARNIVEYRSLRQHPIGGRGSDIIVGAGVGVQTWSNVNGVGIGAHPPLPYWYANPRQRKTVLPF